MKIRSMTAIFGKLDRARLELGDGLNLIYAPNEGGKSTWCAFWRAMLYGFDTRERDRKGRLAEKNRYQPWSGAPMAGELGLEWAGAKHHHPPGPQKRRALRRLCRRVHRDGGAGARPHRRHLRGAAHRRGPGGV